MNTEKGFFHTSDEAILYYEVTGEGEPIVLIPGFAGYTKSFDRNIAGLSAEHKVVVFDPRGFGRSSKTNHGNTVHGHAQDLKELLEYLRLDNVTLMGWSSGGQVAVCYCAEYQCRHLKAVGLIDCPLHPFSSEEWNSHRNHHNNVDAWYDLFYQWVEDPQKYIDWYSGNINPQADTAAKALIARGVQMLPYWIGLEFHYDQCHFNGAALLSQITVPVILFSSDSPNYSEAMARYYMTQIRPYSEIHVHRGATHMMFYNIPDVFNRELLEFIRKVDDKEEL